MALSAGDKLGPYQIVARIGAGGMGEVYKATDTRLGRTVAIKTLNGDQSQRFQQEARAIAALNHPNICVLHDVGPDYLVMEYIEGAPLSSRLEAGAMPLEETLKLAAQIADALEAAHARGILHRDLKPANIMVTSAGAKLLDFGLAKHTGDSESDATQTAAGTVMGTAAYMSPEQAQARPLDARSDIFSFGAVLYEMLSGKRAFIGTSMLEILNAVVRDEPALPQSPAAEIVKRCLAKQPAQRFQSMIELKAALRQINHKALEPRESTPSIAILPFANMSTSSDDEYFSDGLAEEIINALAQVQGLKVIARTSAFSFKGKNEDIRKIAEALGVTNVLEGSVRRSGSRIRVTAQLIQATDGTHLWSQRYDREMSDVFALQDEMSAAIAGQLKIRLTGAKRATTNVAAYEAYLEGRHHTQKFTQDGAAKALECFQRAIALDPNYAPAHVGMAEYYLVESTMGFTPPLQVIPQLEAAARRALALDDTLADAYALLACARMFADYDWPEAERLCLRALELSPTSISATGAYATFYLRAQGRPEEGLAPLERTLEVDPLAALPRCSKGSALFACGRYAEAEREYRRVAEIDPHHPLAYLNLGPVLAFQQRFDEAAAVAKEYVQKFGRWFLPLTALAWVYALTGQVEAARGVLEEVEELGRGGYAPASQLSVVCAALGDHDSAFAWADKAIEQREAYLTTVVRSQYDDSFRADPRYTALLRKMNLA